RARPLLGTFVEIAVAHAPPDVMERAVEAAFAAIGRVHRLMSFHDPHSDVGRLNRAAATRAVKVHAWTLRVIAQALDLHRRSHGAFDLAVAPVLQAMGVLPGRRDDRPPVAMRAGTVEAIEVLPGRRVRFSRPGVAIDLGGIAKGFAVDRAV